MTGLLEEEIRICLLERENRICLLQGSQQPVDELNKIKLNTVIFLLLGQQHEGSPLISSGIQTVT